MNTKYVCVCVCTSRITIGAKGLYPPHASRQRLQTEIIYCSSQFFFVSQKPLSTKIKVTKWVYLENVPQTMASEKKSALSLISGVC